MIKLKQLLPETAFKTKRGSVIRRYHNNVGKQVGNSLYVHKLYADEVIPKAILQKADKILTAAYPEFDYNCIMWDVKRNIIRFDESSDFDTAQEPHVGEYIVIALSGNQQPRKGYSNSIWHHKWMWVKDDYTGFDVDKSKEWSKLWLSKLDEPAKGTDLTWQSQLRKHNLVESLVPSVLLGAIWPDEEIKVIRGEDENARHPFNWSACNKWRYVPEIKYLTWWERPSDREKELVKGYLEDKGFPVARMANLTEERTGKGDDMVYGGIWGSGRIVAHKADDRHPPGHTRDMGHNRWVYDQEKQTVFWHNYPQHADNKIDIENHLARMGYTVVQHKPMEDFYTTKRYIRESTLLMEEVTQEQATAAIDFLKEKVRSGPFKGMVYLAGGPVRDLIMGRVPKDLDVSIVGDIQGGLNFTVWLAKQMGNFKGPTTPPPKPPPDVEVDSRGYPEFSENEASLVRYLEEYNAYYSQYSNPVLFPKFGTAKVFLSGTHKGVSLEGMDVEAVASRKEEYTPGSRKPKVTPGSLKDDVFRRDFTTNSLMMDLTTDEIHDLTGHGIADIKAGILRTTMDPEVIFKEDPLRMMRAVRFMVQKGWQIDPATVESIRHNVAWLKSISKERIRSELDKMLVTSNPELAIRTMRDLGMLRFIAPELQQAVGMTQNIHHKHDVFDHTLEVLKSTKPQLVQRLMALFHDIGKVTTRSETPTGVHFYGHEEAGAEIVDRVLRNLKYPTDIIDAVKAGVANHMRLKGGGDDAVKLSDKALRKFKVELGNNLEDVLDVIHADNIAHADASAMPNQIEKVRQRLKTLDVQVAKPTLPINGNDLLAMGIKKGPMVGKILSAITDAWYENPNITKDQAIDIARKFL